MSENSLVGKNLFNKTHKSKIEICKRLNKLIISKVNKMVFIIKYTKSKKKTRQALRQYLEHIECIEYIYSIYRGFIRLVIRIE